MHRFSDYLYVLSCCRVFVLAAIIAFHFISCEKSVVDIDIQNSSDSLKNEMKVNNDDIRKEVLLFKNDTASFYVARMEIKNLSQSQLVNSYSSICQQLKPFRLPTKREALILRKYYLPEGWWGGIRCLCINDNCKSKSKDECFFSFVWGSGAVTPIGKRTKYAIKPIRTVRLSSSHNVLKVGVNGVWSKSHQVIF